MSDTMQLARCPIVVGVNVDVESIDQANAGRAGLFGRYSYGRYGAREGIWRLFAVFAELDIRATFFVAPGDLERHPELLAGMRDGDHEIAVRGQVCTDPASPARIDSLATDREAIMRLAGVTPRGWRAMNGLLDESTLPALAAAGYRYDSSFKDDDNPYVMANSDGLTLVELPVCDYLSDAPFYAHRHTHERVFKAWEEEADAQYRAGGYVNLTLHTRGDIGTVRLPQVHRLAAFLRNLKSLPGVRFYRAIDLADVWTQVHAEREPFPSVPKPRV